MQYSTLCLPVYNFDKNLYFFKQIRNELISIITIYFIIHFLMNLILE